MSHDPVVVRDSEAGDVAAISEIYAHHVSHGFASFEEVPPDLAEIVRRRAEILARGLPYLVAARPGGGRIAGYAYASPFRTRSAYRFTLENSVYVAPDMQRRGVGRALLAALVPRCAALGYRQMIAVIGDCANALDRPARRRDSRGRAAAGGGLQAGPLGRQRPDGARAGPAARTTLPPRI